MALRNSVSVCLDYAPEKSRADALRKKEKTTAQTSTTRGGPWQRGVHVVEYHTKFRCRWQRSAVGKKKKRKNSIITILGLIPQTKNKHTQPRIELRALPPEGRILPLNHWVKSTDLLKIQHGFRPQLILQNFSSHPCSVSLRSFLSFLLLRTYSTVEASPLAK
jgi:hypothetical protein